MNALEMGVLGFTLLMLIGCIAVMFSLHLSWKKIYEREAERSRELDECRRELEILASSNFGIGRRLERMARDMNWLREQIELSAPAQSEQISYDQVARLAGQGTDAKGLVKVFGISQAEAELVVKLNPDNPAKQPDEKSRDGAPCH